METLVNTLPNMMNALEQGKTLGPLIVFCEHMESTIGLKHQTKEVCANQEENEDSGSGSEASEQASGSTSEEESESENKESEETEERQLKRKRHAEKDDTPAKKRKVDDSGKNQKKNCMALVEELQTLASHLDTHMDTCYDIKSLMLKVGDTVLDINSLSYDDFVPLAEPAPYGNLAANETVYDEKVRKALQIKHFSVHSFSIKNAKATTFEKAMIPIITERGSTFDGATNVRLVPHAVNIYGKGDHFARHVDTQRYPDMIGTLNVIMGEYKGGRFTVFHPSDRDVQRNRLEVTSLKDGEMVALTLRATCPHQVDRVTSGTRISVTFDVCGTMNYYGAKCKALLSRVDEVLACHPAKTHVGITMQHMYTGQDIAQRHFRSAYDHALVEAAGSRGALVSLMWKLNIGWDANGNDENQVYSNAISTLNESDVSLYANALFFSGKDDDIGFRAKYQHQDDAEHCGNESMPGSTNATYLVTLLMIARSD